MAGIEIDFQELDGSPVEENDLKVFRATRELRCTWEDRYELRRLLLTYPQELYPYNENSGARVVSVATRPIGQQNTLAGFETQAEYDYCHMTVVYSTPDTNTPQPNPDKEKEQNPEAVISETLEPYAEALRLDYRKFEWTNGVALERDEAPVRIVKRMKYRLTRHNQKNLVTNLIDYVGKINSHTIQPVLMPDVQFPAQTLLFEPPVVNMNIDTEGTRRYDVTYGFLGKAEGWRFFWNADAKQYMQIRRKSDQEIYNQPEEIDFRNLMP